MKISAKNPRGSRQVDQLAQSAQTTQPTYEHADLAAGRWKTLSLREQMGNIGSEVSRAFKWKEKNPARATRAAERALELFDLTIADPDPVNHPGKLAEICRAREEFCDAFYDGGAINTPVAVIQKYYDYFVL